MSTGRLRGRVDNWQSVWGLMDDLTCRRMMFQDFGAEGEADHDEERRNCLVDSADKQRRDSATARRRNMVSIARLISVREVP